MQKSFSDLEHAAKKKLTRCDRFLAKIDEVTPWPQLFQQIEPFYPRAEGAGRPPVEAGAHAAQYVARQCFGLSDEENSLTRCGTYNVYHAVLLRNLGGGWRRL